MAVKVLLQLKGDASGATEAVSEAETALTGIGSGVDWGSIGTSLAHKAGPMIKQGLIGAALAVGDWLAEGLSEKLATPEGAEAQGSIDELTTELDRIRDKVLTPLVDMIPRVVDLLLPMIAHIDNLVDVALPPLITLMELTVGVLETIATAITNTLEGIGNVIDALTTAVDDVTTFLGNVQRTIQTAIDGITTFFGNIETGINNLLAPIQEAIAPITKLLDDIFGKSQSVPKAGVGGDWGQTPGPQMVRGAGMMTRPSVVNVYTGADPRAVVRALRRYTGDNGDPGGLVRSFRGA